MSRRPPEHAGCTITVLQVEGGWKIHIVRKDGRGKIDAGPYKNEGKAWVLAITMAERFTGQTAEVSKASRWQKRKKNTSPPGRLKPKLE